MSNPTQPPQIITRAAKLALDIAVAQLWQQTRTPQEAVEAIADVIWNDTHAAELMRVLQKIAADAKAGKKFDVLDAADAEAVLAHYADAIPAK